MNVLSCFDGMSCGRIALDKANITSKLITVPGANHGLTDHFEELQEILESNVILH